MDVDGFRVPLRRFILRTHADMALDTESQLRYDIFAKNCQYFIKDHCGSGYLVVPLFPNEVSGRWDFFELAVKSNRVVVDRHRGKAL